MVIEDDPSIAALVEGILSDIGQPAEIRAELGTGSPDPSVRLVISDLVSIRSYDEAAARASVASVRARYPDAAVVVATAHAPAALAADKLGADAVQTKPFDVATFTEVLETLLGR